jgi:uncharacterized membrane protein YphA (DoxX/SURF4 family)
MSVETQPAHATKPTRSIWAGRILSGLICLLFAFSAIGKLLSGPEQSAEMTSHLGLDASLLPAIAIIEIVCVISYAVPRTAIVGAILLTGYMGGAIFAHLRVGDPPIIQVVIPLFVWLGIFLRDRRLRALIPLR